MLRALVVIFGIYVATQVWAYEQKMIMVENENVLCGPITCQLNVTTMCFFTSKITHDSKNGSYLTTCGTCLTANGTTLRESCNTEPETLGNITNSLAISITNSSLDQSRLKNAISGLLMSEMAQANGQPQFGPSVSLTTPPSSYYPQSQQPIIVVQPPAQQIYFGNSPYDGTLNRPVRSPNPDCFPNCEIPPPPPPPPQNFRPNMLPPQLNEAYNLARQMVTDGTKMLSLLQDMSAGLTIPYLQNNNNPGTPPVKQNFPVFTPDTNYY